MALEQVLRETLQGMRVRRDELDAEIKQLEAFIRSLSNGAQPASRPTRSTPKPKQRAKQMSTQERQQQILQTLRQAGKPLTATDVGKRIGVNRSSTGKYMKDMAEVGLLEKQGERKTNGRAMFLYGLPSDPFAHTPPAAVEYAGT